MTDGYEPRRSATERLGAKRDLGLHLGAFVLVNTTLVIIWAATGTGAFWPIWPMGGWAIGLALHAFTVVLSRPISEAAIQAEMQRQRPDSPSAG